MLCSKTGVLLSNIKMPVNIELGRDSCESHPNICFRTYIFRKKEVSLCKDETECYFFLY